MKKNSLLLDADVIIHFHEMRYWHAILANYYLHVGSTVANEVTYYRIGKKKISIDLRLYINRGEMTKKRCLVLT